MYDQDAMQKYLDENGGWLILRDALDHGVSKHDLYCFAEDNALERVGHGIYLSDEAWPDSMYLLHLRSEQAIFSHESALFLHDMADREPEHHSVTVKTGYNPHRLKEKGIKVYTIKADLLKLGLSKARTVFGHEVPVYDPERTLCDILRSRKGMEAQIFIDALKGYTKRPDKNLRKLMAYAEQLRVSAILKPYLEVLL